MKIFGQEYEIIRRDTFHEEDHGMGRADTLRGQIVIRKGMNKDIDETTVLHEVIHVVSDNLELALNETQVAGITCGLYSVGYRLKGNE